jgi:short subunit dehydrogenase-like uncharacterized protein
MERAFDIIVFGATGYTGRLVPEHLLKVYGLSKDLTWAIAGRNRFKLEQIRSEIGASSLPLIIADSSDTASLAAMARRSKVIISAVGPYALYGSELVQACAMEGTDYVDITGESTWISDMLVHEATAKASGARIVFSCGFDSIPFEAGVYFLEKMAMKTFGVPLPRVRARIRRLYGGIRGGTSGGSLATGINLISTMQRNPRFGMVWMDPFALTPGFKGAEQPDANVAYEDKVAGSWVGPWVMAAINSKSVHRCNFLLGFPWGKDFRYDEMSMIDGPPSGVPAPNPFEDPNRPKPGEGPSKADREGGHYDILFIGEAADGQALRVSVKGNTDAGADSTARMLTESAVCLVRDVPRDKTRGGMWTSCSAMGDALIKRLEANAGITFQIESPRAP